ncbi:hypothetical protein D9M73_164140 [compost metagenome]
MLAGPGADLRGIAQHFVGVEVAFEHERTQAAPAAARHISGAAQFQQEHRLAVKVTDAVLAQHVEVLALEPVAGEQRAVGVHQKPFRAAGHGQPPGHLWVEYCSSPAC